VRQQWLFGRRLSARFPCPVGQEIARNPPLRVASYVVANAENATMIMIKESIEEKD